MRVTSFCLYELYGAINREGIIVRDYSPKFSSDKIEFSMKSTSCTFIRSIFFCKDEEDLIMEEEDSLSHGILP